VFPNTATMLSILFENAGGSEIIFARIIDH